MWEKKTVIKRQASLKYNKCTSQRWNVSLLRYGLDE